MSGIDGTDRKILSLLQEDGRITNLELAERVRLSPTATAERVRRLNRDGLILGYTARLAPDKLALGLLVFVEVKLDQGAFDDLGSFADTMRRLPQILECHMVAGSFDYLVKIRVADMAAFRDFLADILLQIPGVRETRTYTVMEEVKSDGLLPI